MRTMRNLRCRGAQKGMTLIEILIALLVMVLGVLGIMALFPPALQSASESMEETNAAILSESVAHSLAEAFSAAEDDKQSAKLQLRCTMSHDMKAGEKTRGRYTFILPPLPTNPLTNPEWYHYPSSATDAAFTSSTSGSTCINAISCSDIPRCRSVRSKRPSASSSFARWKTDCAFAWSKRITNHLA